MSKRHYNNCCTEIHTFQKKHTSFSHQNTQSLPWPRVGNPSHLQTANISPRPHSIGPLPVHRSNNIIANHCCCQFPVPLPGPQPHSRDTHHPRDPRDRWRSKVSVSARAGNRIIYVSRFTIFVAHTHTPRHCCCCTQSCCHRRLPICGFHYGRARVCVCVCSHDRKLSLWAHFLAPMCRCVCVCV